MGHLPVFCLGIDILVVVTKRRNQTSVGLGGEGHLGPVSIPMPIHVACNSNHSNFFFLFPCHPRRKPP